MATFSLYTPLILALDGRSEPFSKRLQASSSSRDRKNVANCYGQVDARTADTSIIVVAFFVMTIWKNLNRVHLKSATSKIATASVIIANAVMPANVKAQVDFRNDQVGNTVSDNGGSWGGWTRPVFCPPGTWAGGYTMRIEPEQGSGDDTALNAVALYCRDRGGREVARISPHPGYWGAWGEGANCPQASFLTHFSLKVERSLGGGKDDTAANSVKFACSNGTVIEARGQKWGSYGGWLGGFRDSAICGMRAKVEGKQGGGDDTALNDLEFFWCSVR